MKLTNQQIKYTKIGAGVALSIFLLYLAFGKKKQDAGGQVNDPTNNNDSSSTFFDPVKVAEILYKAMKDVGTDEDLIFNTLKNVSQVQFAKVIEAFGVRNYNTFTGNTFSLVKHSLPVWLESELSESDYSTLKLKYPNHL
ncbi:MAG: hypothetical protein CMP76_08030 [Flavobacterium sp.]|uniref:hypothetical protein n=1 Tax=Flavobacterium sp. TaxID=239 RepID=UPI000C60CC0C|nr:hypothetical protein [Flavobacterium sp.]MBF03229.1 hypothetical protein [Flavobacterium sp.]|tara:strand:+ start:221 stop:640 length:420 start_codon:yes stop_codon:yes gene_type:complete